MGASPPFESPPKADLKGIGVSPGIAIGPAFLLTHQDEAVVERALGEEEIPREMERFEAALQATREQIHDIQQKVSSAIGHDKASLFDAHLMVVDDRSFIEEVIRRVRVQRINVEAVLRSVSDRYAQVLANVGDDYLRERAADIHDVTRRILRNLAGRNSTFLDQIDEPCVVIAHDLTPSDTASLTRSMVIAFATDRGSPTSHTAIMARALGIPAVVGLHDISVRISSGEPVLIDGHKGIAILRPDEATRERYGKIREERETIEISLASLKDEPAVTRDGYNVLLAANIEFPGDVDVVLARGAAGVGLFRTEYLYLSRDTLPSEDEQTEAYEEVARRLAPDHAIIRTLDLGGDKLLSRMGPMREVNPFMGWRAIRYCLANPKLFKTQLRAVLRASRHGNLKLMYPMVSNVDEVHRANALLDECREELRAEGVPFDEDLEVGVMIEVPSAALTANLIAPHVSFFSLGTNDLAQYTLAVDRGIGKVAYLYEPTHPAIIRLIQNTVETGHEHGIWTGICGEMAGNPFMTPLLIGLGLDELSVSPTSVPPIKHVIRRLSYPQAEALAEEAVRSESGRAVLDLCRELLREVAPEILELVD